jgi:hypothetical protein
MGYRSEVAYGVKVDDIVWTSEASEKEKNLSADGIFLVMLTEMQGDEVANKCFDETHEINEYLVIDKEARTIRFHAEELKWYDSYEDVKAHERMYQIITEYAEQYEEKENMHNPISCNFARLGEEFDDIEERPAGDDPYSVISLYRGMTVDI